MIGKTCAVQGVLDKRAAIGSRHPATGQRMDRRTDTEAHSDQIEPKREGQS